MFTYNTVLLTVVTMLRISSLFPSPGDLPNPGIEPVSPALQADSLPLSHLGSPNIHIIQFMLESQFQNQSF